MNENKTLKAYKFAEVAYVRTYVRTDGRLYGQSRDNQNFFARWVTKFRWVWGSAGAPLWFCSVSDFCGHNLHNIHV